MCENLVTLVATLSTAITAIATIVVNYKTSKQNNEAQLKLKRIEIIRPAFQSALTAYTEIYSRIGSDDLGDRSEADVMFEFCKCTYDLMANVDDNNIHDLLVSILDTVAEAGYPEIQPGVAQKHKELMRALSAYVAKLA